MEEIKGICKPQDSAGVAGLNSLRAAKENVGRPDELGAIFLGIVAANMHAEAWAECLTRAIAYYRSSGRR